MSMGILKKIHRLRNFFFFFFNMKNLPQVMDQTSGTSGEMNGNNVSNRQRYVKASGNFSNFLEKVCLLLEIKIIDY